MTDHVKAVLEARKALQDAINEAIRAGYRVNVNRSMLANLSIGETGKVAPAAVRAPAPATKVDAKPAAEAKPTFAASTEAKG